MKTRHWLQDALGPDETLDPTTAGDLLRVCEELLTTTFLLLQHQAPSLRRQQTLAHLGAALGEVDEARGWQGET